MTFKISKDLDEWLYLQVVLIFLIGYCINVNSNGVATLIFLHNEYGIKEGLDYGKLDLVFNLSNKEYIEGNIINYSNLEINNENELFLDNTQRILKEYSQDITLQNKKAIWIVDILYFVISPLINYIFFIRWFFFIRKKKVVSKPLNTLN